MIQYICRGCRTVHQAETSEGGSVRECFLCGAKVQVPKPGVLVSPSSRAEAARVGKGPRRIVLTAARG